MAIKHAFYDDDRAYLHTILPLDTPLSLGIDTSTVCNFRCKYCAQSAPEKFSEINFSPEIMRMETFERIVEQCGEFPSKIKKIHLECKGEPLCNPNIAKMVKFLKQSNVTDCVQIITNGALLSSELSDALIDAGLDILCISMQGMSEEAYYKTCGCRIDFQQFINQIKYYFRHKTHGKLFIKNVDVALNGEDEKELFFSLLSDYADRIYIEKIANLFSTIDYKNIIQKDEGINRYGEKLYKAQVCAFPFYYLLIFPNGDIRPCTNIISSARLGNVYSDTLVRVWNGKMRQAFLKMQLEHRRFLHPVCRECHRPYENLRPEDRLDGYEDMLCGKYGF